ncbi:PEP-CTERM sorting domain-containing protein [Prosthecobacter sp.]|uniref:PEP-CTERM sorting domain-containing protein n=1 Tax=Prosthecobacter sp. TaxID=1965333 RepID=UPI003784A4BB
MSFRFTSLIVVLCGSLILPASAAVTVYEGFDYGAGDINGASGGTGLAGSWSSQGSGNGSWGAQGFEQTSGLTFANLDVSGGAATFSAINGTNGTGVMSRGLSSAYGSDFTVWGSYLFNASGETTPWAGFTLADGQTMFNDASGRFGVATPYDGASNLSSYGSYFLGNGGGSGAAMNLNETYMFLFKFDKSGSSASGSMAWLLNAAQFTNFKTSDDLLTESELNSASIGTGDLDVMARLQYSSSGYSSVSSFDTVTFDARNFYTSNARTITVDELRFSDTSLDELTPVFAATPEPSRTLLLMGGLFAAAARRRRSSSQR